MGKKKSRDDSRVWCWYCERDFEDEKILISHQKAKHFKCDHCQKRMNTAGGLVVHGVQVHQESVTRVPNALPGRDTVDIEIYGMQGVPDQYKRLKLGDDDSERDPAHAFKNLPNTGGFGPSLSTARPKTTSETNAAMPQAAPGAPWPAMSQFVSPPVPNGSAIGSGPAPALPMLGYPSYHMPYPYQMPGYPSPAAYGMTPYPMYSMYPMPVTPAMVPSATETHPHVDAGVSAIARTFETNSALQSPVTPTAENVQKSNDSFPASHPGEPVLICSFTDVSMEEVRAKLVKHGSGSAQTTELSA